VVTQLRRRTGQRFRDDAVCTGLLPGPRLHRQQGDHGHQQHEDRREEQGQPTDGIEVQSTPPLAPTRISAGGTTAGWRA
jgi:hypothetical protein